MRGQSFFAAVAMAASALASPAAVAVAPREFLLDERRAKRHRKAVAAASLAKRYCSRGAQAKPKKRPNRLHISKRVRRKHRRAA